MAAIDLDKMIQNFERLTANAVKLLENEVENIAEDGKALVTQRIVETGKDEQNNPFTAYTPEYQKRKERAGRYRGIVDFTFTGQMFSSIGIIETKSETGQYIVTVGGRDELTKDIMRGHENHRPGWFSLSAEEKKMLAEDSESRLARTIEELLTS